MHFDCTRELPPQGNAVPGKLSNWFRGKFVFYEIGTVKGRRGTHWVKNSVGDSLCIFTYYLEEKRPSASFPGREQISLRASAKI